MTYTYDTTVNSSIVSKVLNHHYFAILCQLCCLLPVGPLHLAARVVIPLNQDSEVEYLNFFSHVLVIIILHVHYKMKPK